MHTTFLRLSIFCASALIIEAASAPVVPPASVVNNASFAVGTNPLTPGTIAAIFGSNLDDGTNNQFSSFGPNGELLTTLGGASVTFNGIPAPMFSAFPGQLNVQIPEGLGSASSATVVVTVAGQSSAPQTVPLGSFSPGLFSLNQKGTGQGAIQIANTSTYAASAGSISGASSQAVKPGDFITIYCTGLGAVNNPPAPGAAATNNPLSTTKTNPTVTIGGEPATVSFAGLSPGYVGLYQVNAQIPADAAGGSAVTVQLSVGGVKSNSVSIAIAGNPAPSGSKIAGGGQHTCALNNAGAVFCWGSNSNGQLGNGTTTKSLTPVAVKGLPSGVVGISAGQYFTCALTKAGAVWCWGYNNEGELGNSTTTDSDVPTQVLDPAGTAPMSGVIAIASGLDHTCAVTGAGTVLCWGNNTYNDFGTEPTVFRSGLPSQVTGIPGGMVAISLASSFTCALTNTGVEWCWGFSSDGGLGAGNLTNYNPVAVLNPAGTAPLGGVASIGTSYYSACAVTNGGSLLCWGANQSGEVGNNTNTQVNLPVQVLNSGIVTVSGGEGDMCALNTAGGVLCWGAPYNGDLGNTETNASEIPVPVASLTSGVIELASGLRQNCALMSTGGVMCWGSNLNGQIGNNSTTDAHTPVQVLGVGGVGFLQLF